MSESGVVPWVVLERWSGTAFLAGAAMFVLSAVITVVDIAVGVEQLRLHLGQVTVGLGWLGGLVGLLGIHRRLAERNRWLVRVGTFFVAIGLVGYVLVTVGFLATFAGAPESVVSSMEPVFVPSMLLGSVLTFPLFGVAVLRTDDQPRRVGLLLFGPTALFAANVATPSAAEVILVVIIGLVLVNAAIGYLLRRGSRLADSREAERSNVPTAR